MREPFRLPGQALVEVSFRRCARSAGEGAHRYTEAVGFGVEVRAPAHRRRGHYSSFCLNANASASLFECTSIFSRMFCT
jgi:hypothetical protein